MITREQIVDFGYNILYKAKRMYKTPRREREGIQRFPANDLLPKDVSDTFRKKVEGCFVSILDNGHTVRLSFYDDVTDDYYQYPYTESEIYSMFLLGEEFEERDAFSLGYTTLKSIPKDESLIERHYYVKDVLIKKNDVIKVVATLDEKNYTGKELILLVSNINSQVMECKIANDLHNILCLYHKDIRYIEKYEKGRALFEENLDKEKTEESEEELDK